MSRRLYLAAYDVPSAKRLRKALKVARRYASGGQKSIHECWLSAQEKTDLLRDMADVLHPRDQFALIALDPRRTALLMGTAVSPSDPDYYLIH